MAYCLMMATWPVHCALRSFGFFVVIGPQRVVRFECYCMIGLGASAGGEAGRGSAATLLLDRVRPAAGEALLPLAWKYVSNRMSPEEESAWRQAARRGQGASG